MLEKQNQYLLSQQEVTQAVEEYLVKRGLLNSNQTYFFGGGISQANELYITIETYRQPTKKA